MNDTWFDEVDRDRLIIVGYGFLFVLLSLLVCAICIFIGVAVCWSERYTEEATPDDVQFCWRTLEEKSRVAENP